MSSHDHPCHHDGDRYRRAASSDPRYVDPRTAPVRPRPRPRCRQRCRKCGGSLASYQPGHASAAAWRL